jgi:Iron-containing redox enzyme
MPSVATALKPLEAEPNIDFGPFRDSQLDDYGGTPERHLYFYLLHVDEHQGVLPKAFDLAKSRLKLADQLASDVPEPLNLPDYDDLSRGLQVMRAWWLDQQDELAKTLKDLTREQCEYLLRQFAPTALLDGCWLQNFSSAGTSHKELTAGMLKLYSHEVGDGYPARHHGNTYRDLIQSMGLYLPEVGSFEFIEQRDVIDASFRFPVFLLCISQFPRSFTPEILGLTLFYYVCGICPLYLALGDRLEQLGAGTRFLNMHLMDTCIRGPAETAVGMVRHYMETAALGVERDFDQHWRRIRRGFIAAYAASREGLDRGVRYARSPAKSPREKMIELIARKAHHASGYHAASMMHGKSIDDWLNPEHLDPEQFLSEFARSRYVKPGDSKGSLLLSKLTAFGGSMFRVFPPDELQVIAEWIDSLPQDQDSSNSGSSTAGARLPLLDRAGSNGGSPPLRKSRRDFHDASIKKYSQKPLGELYYYLLNIEHFPDVRPYALHFAKRWLNRAGTRLRHGVRPIPFEPYEHQALDAWLDAQHKRQVGSYKKQTGEPVQTREQVIEATVQAAPMILIDGAWVQNAANASTSHSQVGSKLFHIYVDEVGNGDVKLNHPNVYRELLAQMDVELPEFGTLEFSRWPGFRPEAFQVPVFWLCISQFPKRFLSETLGLNLAMELSGVGGTYRNTIDTLRYHGFDPLFVELHNTIDNVSTGHTAWAIESIKYHMDEMFARGGAGLVEKHWRRVWRGYRALSPPTGFVSWLCGSVVTYWDRRSADL